MKELQKEIKESTISSGYIIIEIVTIYYAVQLLLAGTMAWVKNQKLWFNWNGKIHPCAKFPGKKKWKSLDAFPRGEVHNREEGEMAPKSREEGVLPSCTSPFFLYLHSD